MNDGLKKLAIAEMARSKKSLTSAKILMRENLHEDAMSRAYYAVLHAAKAALIIFDVRPISHSGVQRMFSLHLVKSGKIDKKYVKIFMAGQADREIGDYDIFAEVEHDRSRQRVNEAEKFVEAISEFLQSEGVRIR